MRINTYFTKDKKVKKIIIDHLDKANTHVCVAVAWFTDIPLFNKLLELQKRSVHVEVIITNHEFNQSCANNFSQINENGGFFAEVGNDESLMHMKFCVIDYNVVISGSANWSNKAFTTNNEEVTIVENHPQRANDFIDEFNRLKELSGKLKNCENELSLLQSYKLFDLIKALINLGETSAVNRYVQQLKPNPELAHIVEYLIQSDFQKAIEAMNEFVKSHSTLIDVSSIEKQKLLSQINLLAMQIETLNIEKVEAEKIIDQFIHRYRIELNPLIGKILLLKKKIYEKLKKRGVEDKFYEELENEFRQKNEEYEHEVSRDIPELTKDEYASIKDMYRDASKYCHPDSSNCIFQDKSEANTIFSQLSDAYKNNDIQRVKMMLDELKAGNVSNIENINDLEILKAKLLSLQQKYEMLLFELKSIRNSDDYKLITSISNWDDYFTEQKQNLESEYNNLNQEFVKK
jgi:phosphatidylserine/phosphatidylglycerophosphate/cardiolipin synthase-like enzyme